MLTKKSFGFTLIELLVIIGVLSILVTLTLVVAGNWRISTAQTEVKSDLKSVKGAMENARNFGTGYPTSIPSTFTASPNVTVTYEWGSSSDYCIEARSTAETTVMYYFDSTHPSGEPQPGTC
jgi:type II secretory pathway pseudopilin PulG